MGVQHRSDKWQASEDSIDLTCLTKYCDLLRVHRLQKLPTSLVVILNSPRVLKIGRNVSGDLAKLASDFSVTVPPKRNKSREGVIELGALAKSRNVISNGNASLTAITAAMLHKNLSKDTRISEWSAPELSIEQREYAALDAWIVLSIYDLLKQEPKAKGVLHDVWKGWISDPAGIPLYTIRFHDKHGLPVYHCIQGTNSVEGAVHNPSHGTLHH